MKILYLVHQYFPRHIGGTEIYLRGLVRRARSIGHQCKIITCHETPSGDPEDFRIEWREHEGIPVGEIHFNLSVTPHPARNEFDNPFVGRVIAKVLGSFKPDLVHVMQVMKLSASALRACHVAKVPMVITLCDYWLICPRHTLLTFEEELCNGPKHPFDCQGCLHDLHKYPSIPKGWRNLKPYFKDTWAISERNKVLRREVLKAERIIALSAFLKKQFVLNKYPSNRIEVIQHGLELEHSERSEKKESDKIRIGFIGHLKTFKGPHIILEALKNDPSLPVEFHIYGEFLGNEYCRRLKELAGEDSRVIFKGSFPPSDFSTVVTSVDILTLPALWYENSPLVVQAALHLGIPVLASDIGSLAEQVIPGVNGWLVKPGDVAEMTRTLQKICSSPLPKFESGQGKTIDENAKEMLAIYEEVVTTA